MIDRGPTKEQLKQLAKELVSQWEASNNPLNSSSETSGPSNIFDKLVRARLLRWDLAPRVSDFVLRDSGYLACTSPHFTLNGRELIFISPQFVAAVKNELQEKNPTNSLHIFQRVD